MYIHKEDKDMNGRFYKATDKKPIAFKFDEATAQLIIACEGGDIWIGEFMFHPDESGALGVEVEGVFL